MADQARIPLVDLAWQHAVIAEEVRAGFDRVIASGAFVQGPDVRAFEEEMAAASGVAHCVGVANGTDALELLLRADGIGPGDEVVLPANTFIATAEAVVRAGATPVLVDCDAHHLIDVEQAVSRCTPRTKAVMAVHLYGQLADVAAIRAALAGGVVRVFEDAAQAQGARRHGVGIGGGSDGAATSFYPGKNLGAYGDAGAVLTDDAARAARIRLLADHGSPEKHHHEVIGWNSRLDTLQAVVLRAKLRHLEHWNADRAQIAHHYDELLADLPEVQRPEVAAGNEHVWHLYVVQVDRRDEVLGALRAEGIEASVHYPRPVHLQPAFAHLAQRGAFPVAEAQADRLLSLPLHPGMTEAQVGRVAGALRSAVQR